MSEGGPASISFIVNGQRQSVTAHPLTRLLDVLREYFHLTGTKEGCGEGECGACAVLVNGELVNSCLVPILQVQNTEVMTIEGMAADERAKLLQDAFVQCGGAQCGICIPGMIVAAYSLLERIPNPTDADLRSTLSGNLCRCTGYMRILDAIKSASGKLTQATAT